MIGDAGGSNQASKFGTIDLKVPGGLSKLAQAEEIREPSDFPGFRGPGTLPYQSAAIDLYGIRLEAGTLLFIKGLTSLSP
jgi:hypothetical protein